jgi:hypothetical protein
MLTDYCARKVKLMHLMAAISRWRSIKETFHEKCALVTQGGLRVDAITLSCQQWIFLA